MSAEDEEKPRKTRGEREPYAPWGEFIKFLQKKWGVSGQRATYAAMGERFGVAANTIGDWRKGETPQKSTARVAADNAGLPRSMVLFAAGYVPNPEDIEWDKGHYPESGLGFDLSPFSEDTYRLNFVIENPDFWEPKK